MHQKENNMFYNFYNPATLMPFSLDQEEWRVLNTC